MEGKPVSVPIKHPHLTKLMHSPIVWAVLTILSMLGIVLTVFTFFPPIKKQLTYTIESQSVISSEQSVLDDLEITYMGNKITSLQSTNIKIWNSGSEAIRSSDLASLRPLAVNVTDMGNLFKASIINVSNEVNRFSCSLDPEKSRVLINFEFINPNDYVYVQLLHSSSLTYTVDTEIIGGAKKSIILYNASEVKAKIRRIMLIMFILMTSTILIYGIIANKMKNVSKIRTFSYAMIVFFSLFVVFTIIGLFIIG